VCGCFSETPANAENDRKTGPKRLFLALTGPNRFLWFPTRKVEIFPLPASTRLLERATLPFSVPKNSSYAKFPVR